MNTPIEQEQLSETGDVPNTALPAHDAMDLFGNGDMDSSELPLVSELMVLNTIEFNRYLDDNDNVFSVRDPENITAVVLQRLRQHTHVQGEAVDLEKVNEMLQNSINKPARILLNTSAEEDNMKEILGVPSGFGEPNIPWYKMDEIPEEWELLEDDVVLDDWEITKEIESEEKFHAELLKVGGRPLYDIKKLPEIVKDSKGHLELIKAIQYEKFGDLPYWIDVFCTQYRSLQTFHNCKFRDHRATAESLDKFNKKVEPLQRMVGITPPFTFLADAEKQDVLTEWVEYICYDLDIFEAAKRPLRRFQETRSEPWAWYLSWQLDQIPLIRQEMAEADLKRRQEQGHAAEEDGATVVVTSSVSTDEVQTNSQAGLSVQEQEQVVNEEATATTTAASDPTGEDSNSQAAPAVPPTKKRPRKRSNVATIPTRRSARIAALAAARQQAALKVMPPEPKPAPRRKRRASSSAFGKSKRQLVA